MLKYLLQLIWGGGDAKRLRSTLLVFFLETVCPPNLVVVICCNMSQKIEVPRTRTAFRSLSIMSCCGSPKCRRDGRLGRKEKYFQSKRAASSVYFEALTGKLAVSELQYVHICSLWSAKSKEWPHMATIWTIGTQWNMECGPHPMM